MDAYREDVRYLKKKLSGSEQPKEVSQAQNEVKEDHFTREEDHQFPQEDKEESVPVIYALSADILG